MACSGASVTLNSSYRRWGYAIGISTLYYAALVIAWQEYSAAENEIKRSLSAGPVNVEAGTRALDTLFYVHDNVFMVSFSGYITTFSLIAVIYKLFPTSKQKRECLESQCVIFARRFLIVLIAMEYLLYVLFLEMGFALTADVDKSVAFTSEIDREVIMRAFNGLAEIMAEMIQVAAYGYLVSFLLFVLLIKKLRAVGR